MSIINNLSGNFSKIQEKYNNFMVPSYEISIDGKIIKQEELLITNITINLALKDKSGGSNFSVSNCYSSSEKGFNKNVKSILKLGSIVKISLGYSNNNTQLFLGYIDSISYGFDGTPKIDVNCLDVMAILMKNKVEERKLPDKSSEEVIKDIFNKYSKFIASSKIDTLQPIDHQIVQDEDDYKFIAAIAKENNCDFFAVGEKVYVCNLKSIIDIAVTLSYRINVMSFSRQFQFNSFQVTAYGKNDGSNATVSGSYTYETEYAYVNPLKENCEKIIIRSPRIDNADKAKKIASNKGKEMINRGFSSSIQCIGLPELIPGRYVTLNDFDPDINGTFYITSADHTFSPGQYKVSLNISNSE